jgi:chitinase
MQAPWNSEIVRKGVLFMARTTLVRVLFIALLLIQWFLTESAFSSIPGARAPLLVGYFPQWGLDYAEPFYVKSLITNGAVQRLDQINYAQASVRGGRCSLADRDADLAARFTRENSVSGKSDGAHSRFRGYIHQLQELKRRYPHLKILISLEGDPRDFAKDAEPENRAAFVRSCVDTFLRGHFSRGIREPGIFDGFDIDWESPQEKDAANFRALLEEFRGQMNAARPGSLLSLAVAESPQTLAGTDFSAIAPLVDEVGVMNYDYAGPWSQTTGLLAPLFSTDPQHPHSIERSIDSYEAAGVPREKLLMGLPFYGYSWTEVKVANRGLFQSGRPVKEDRPYNRILSDAANSEIYRDWLSQAPWLFDGRTFWTYKDPTSVRFKASYVSQQHLGGMMIWELSGDTADAELLGVAYQSLRQPLEENVSAQRSSRVRTQVP